jgi:enoyl-CoA hydratase
LPVSYEQVEPHIVLVTIDRPEARNALDPESFTQLAEAWRKAELDDDVWVVVVTGAGDRSFCAGADLKASVGTGAVDMETTHTALLKHFPLSKAVVAAVNGYCIAGGMEILLGTDIRLAVPEAEFGLQEVRWAIFPFGGGALKLARQIPYAKAMELLLLGNRIGAEEALRWGLINRIVERDALLDEAMNTARALAANGPLSIRAIKRVVHRTFGLPTDDEVAYETEQAIKVFSSDDAREGPRAFAEKRSPNYRGA